MLAAPGTACAHVVFLEGGAEEQWYPRSRRERFLLHRPGPTQRAIVQAALGMLTPVHCAGVGRVAFVSLNRSTTGGMTYAAANRGDLILLNATYHDERNGLGLDELSLSSPWQRAVLLHSVIHEAAHAAEFHFNDVGGHAGFTGDWDYEQRLMIHDVIQRVRLGRALRIEWQDLNDSFVDHEWAVRYYGWPLNAAQIEQMRLMTPEELASDGFMSIYGANTYADDIAEMLAWAITGPVFRELGVREGPMPLTNDFACIAMQRNESESVPQGLAAVYTKLAFLRDLGLLSDEAFQRCVGPNTGLPTVEAGITVYADGEVQRLFTTGPEATIGRSGEQYVFTLRVRGTAEWDGEPAPGELTLQLVLGPTEDLLGDPIPIERVSWPRGAFSLGLTSPHSFQLRLDDHPAGDFDVTDGFVLVAEATNDRIVGSVFAREAFRPNAPVPVPQTFDPPLQFRFRLEN